MALCRRILLLLSLVGVAIIVQQYRSYTSPVPKPKLKADEYWGPGSATGYTENTAIKPFKVNVQKEVIVDLVEQLKRPLKIATPLEGINFEYGFNNDALKRVVAYWRDNYLPKWNERQNFFNKFPQYTTQIQGLNIHYLHIKPQNYAGKQVLPLLLLHGWPGSVREFYELIPLLTTPNDATDFVYEVIAPSLVGYGWSQAAAKPGFGPLQMAVVMRNLMLRVGKEQFFIQGGDWGSLIGANIAMLYPQNVLGYHSNMCTAGLSNPKEFLTKLFPAWFVKPEHLDFIKPLGQWFGYLMEETGYFHIQATKPDTVGVGLLNSPVGLAAYILEKFSTWTNVGYRNLPDGGLTQRYTWEALLDNIMVYYVTDSITTSQRLYAEAFSKQQLAHKADLVEITVPSGAARFMHDLSHSTDWALKDRFSNLLHSTYHKDGGHFAALELPQILYADFVDFVKKVYIYQKQQHKN